MERREKLLSLLTQTAEHHEVTGRRFEVRVDACWWGTVLLAGSASVIGLVPICAVPGWIVSLIAASASALEWLRRSSGWRARSNANYALGVEARELWSRLEFQMPATPSSDQIALIARELDEAKDRFGDEMARINHGRDSKPARSPNEDVHDAS